jgi:Holliday junction resolvase RusA-like endonuclease
VHGVGRELRFVVYGLPKPGGSKRAFVHPKTGAVVVTEQVDNRGWRQEVAEAGRRAMAGAPPLVGAVGVTFVFYRPRPKSHYGTGRNAGVLKPSAPAYPTSAPDAGKLARPAEDALTAIVWRDDAQIIDEVLSKRWGLPRCEVTVLAL